MKILWVTNAILPQIAVREGVPSGGATWLDALPDALTADGGNRLSVLFNRAGAQLAGGEAPLRYASFAQDPLCYSADNERFFAETLAREKPDVVHVWGTEFPSALAMLRACERAGMLERTVVSIQGLCGVCAGHYTLGLPSRVVCGTTFRDFVRRDNIARQRKKFARRGVFEAEALRLAPNVIGRTDWDYACARQIHPDIRFFRCNETMRAPFYEGAWTPAGCRRRTLFLPQSYYPIKGTHFALETLAVLRRDFPDARLVTTGADPRSGGFPARLRRSSYARYIAARIRALGLDENITFLGTLNAVEMKAQYLSANVCLSASTVENSPNGVGEAMLVGTPLVASFVGGTPALLAHGTEGFFYPADAPYLAAEYARRIFCDDALALRLSCAARERARVTHEPAANLAALQAVYRTMAEGAK